MVFFYVSTFILQLQLAGGYDLGSCYQPGYGMTALGTQTYLDGKAVGENAVCHLFVYLMNNMAK